MTIWNFHATQALRKWRIAATSLVLIPCIESCESGLTPSTAEELMASAPSAEPTPNSSESPTISSEFLPTSTMSDVTAKKFKMANCIDPDLSKLAQGQFVSLCNGTKAEGTASLLDFSKLTAANIKAGVTIAGVTGTSIGGATACATGGQTGCLANSSYLAINARAVEPDNLRSTSIAGSGKLKYCRAGYDLSVMDLPNAYVNMHYYGRTFTAAAGTDLLTIGKANTFMSGLGSVPVQVSTSGTLPAPLATNTTYYSIWVSTTTIKLAVSEANADTGTFIDITDAGTGTHRIKPVGDGIAQYWDVMDDTNSTNSTRGNWFTNSYFGIDYLCAATDWRILAPSANGSTINAGTASDCDAVGDDCMIQDKITGEIWTEVNPNGGGGSLTWAESITFCDNLNFGGYNDWRLPTHKEFLQANINGLYLFEINFPQSGTSAGFFRTATMKSQFWDASSTGSFWIHGNGGSQAEYQTNTTQFGAAYKVRCVRN